MTLNPHFLSLKTVPCYWSSLKRRHSLPLLLKLLYLQEALLDAASQRRVGCLHCQSRCNLGGETPGSSHLHERSSGAKKGGLNCLQQKEMNRTRALSDPVCALHTVQYIQYEAMEYPVLWGLNSLWEVFEIFFFKSWSGVCKTPKRGGI